MPGSRIFFKTEHLASPYPALQLPADLSFEIGPGLSLLRGGDGRGKSSVLRMIAGSLAPGAGVVLRNAESIFFETPADEAHDAVVVRAWLLARCGRFTGWRADVEAALIQRFALAEHLDKPMFMLSTGSRRKVGLVAAAASGAALTLLDTPFAALDGSSRQVLTMLLAEAAGSSDRAWVIADHERPVSLAGVAFSGQIDLGD
ncbi:N/A [soil metagenome]